MKVLIIGASLNPSRISNRLIKMLQEEPVEIIAIGKRAGQIGDVHIHTELIITDNVHTVSLYINPTLQPAYYEYILSLNPTRVIFNPGTENSDFAAILTSRGIPWENSCNLVMVSTGQFI